MVSNLAILGGAPVRTQPFPTWPVFGAEEEESLLRSLRSGKWGKLDGEEVARFELQFADYHQAKHGLAVVNGTVGLRLALLAAGIEAGDEVIVPPYTFIATASAVVEANAVPVFVDLDLDTFNLDLDAVEAAITPRTRAVIPVHFGGLPIDMERIQAMAARHRLTVIEDACHAHGAEYRKRRVGALGDLGVFSFQSTKNLTCGEGGILITNDDELAQRCWSLHNCGRLPDRMWYEHFGLGGNYRLGEMQGALLNAQWQRFPDQADTREENGRYLDERLGQFPGVHPQKRTSDCTRHGYHLFCLRLDPQILGISREIFLQALAAEGVPALPGYAMGLHQQEFFTQARFGPYSGARPGSPYTPGSCPNCEKICAEQGVWLLQNLLLGGSADMDEVVNAFEKVYEGREQLKGEG